MTTKLEIERRWLVKSGYELIDDYKWIDYLFIRQWYFTYVNEPEKWFRLRRIYHDRIGNYSYWYCTKQATDTLGISIETEREITYQEFVSYYENRIDYELTGFLDKTRKVFKYLDHVFELDEIYSKTGIIDILECELQSIDEPLELPPGLVLQEITGDYTFSNRFLAAQNIK